MPSSEAKRIRETGELHRMVSRELSRIGGKLIDLYYEQDNLNSKTAKDLMSLKKWVSDTNDLLMFGPGEGHNQSRAERD